MERTKRSRKGLHKVWELPEEFTGAQLRSFARKEKIPMLKRKMRRTRFPEEPKKEKKLHRISIYIKGDEIKRTKFKNNE